MRGKQAAGSMRRGPVAAMLAGSAIAIVAVVLLLLLPYGGREEPGFSYDTPYYVWRTRAVAFDGLGVLTTIPTGAVPERPGVPVLGALLGGTTGVDALTFSVIVRALAAVAIGLAAGAMAVEALGEPRWAFGVFVVGLGTSAAVVGTAVGSLDQLLVDVPLVATAAVAPLAASGRRGVTVAVACLVAAAVATHWVFAALFLLLLVGVVLALMPGSLAERRSGSAWSTTPSARLVRVLLVAAAATAITLVVLPALPDRLPPAIGERGNRLRLGAYELPLLLPLAAVGFVLTIRRAEDSRRTTIVLLGMWAASVPAAIAVSSVLPTPIKLFRVAPFALGVPALVTLGLIAVATRVGSRWGRGGTIVGSLVLAAGLLWASGSPASSFDDAAAAAVAERMRQARLAGRYLEEIPRAGRPVIFVTAGSPRLLDRVARSAVPPDLISDTWVFVGRPDDLAIGGPLADRDRPRLTEVAQRWWAAAWPSPDRVLGQDPIVIQIAAPGRTVEEAFELGRGVAVIRGPRPPPSFEPPPPFGAGWSDLVAATAVAFVLLVLTGAGWALALPDVSGPAALGLSPAFGVAALVLAGTLADRFGLSLGGATGVAIVLATAAIGWVVFVLGRTASPGRSNAGAEGPPVG